MIAHCNFGTALEYIIGVMRKYLLSIPLFIACISAQGQKTWTMEECMAYAAHHSTSVKQARWDLATADADKLQALGDFFPSVTAQAGAQYNWGRNIDPETNAYNNVTTFNNNYGIYASMTLWDGGYTFNQYKRARAQRRRNANAIDMQADDRAIATMMAYTDAVYYHSSIRIAADRLEQSRATLALVEREEQLGTKSRPDVAQAQSTVADDEYNLIHQQNLYAQAMLTLRSNMNLPHDESLTVDSSAVAPSEMPLIDDPESIYRAALHTNPAARDAELGVTAQKYAYRAAKGNFSPTVSINGGISTSYYKTLTGGIKGPGFSDQFKNNRGEYLSVTVSIPLFSGFSRCSAVKKAKINLEKAKLDREDSLRRLSDDITAAVNDCNGYAMEVRSLEAKVKSDKLAYDLNRRKYEEGMLSLIDLQLSANTYFSSRVTLLQKQMLYILKHKLVDYYKGIPLFDNKSMQPEI